MGLNRLSTPDLGVHPAGPLADYLASGSSEELAVGKPARRLPFALEARSALPAPGGRPHAAAGSDLACSSLGAARWVLRSGVVVESVGAGFARRLCVGKQFRHLHQGDRARVVSCCR